MNNNNQYPPKLLAKRRAKIIRQIRWQNFKIDLQSALVGMSGTLWLIALVIMAFIFMLTQGR